MEAVIAERLLGEGIAIIVLIWRLSVADKAHRETMEWLRSAWYKEMLKSEEARPKDNDRIPQGTRDTADTPG